MQALRLLDRHDNHIILERHDDPARQFLSDICSSLDGLAPVTGHVAFPGAEALPSVHAVTDLAAASIGAAYLAGSAIRSSADWNTHPQGAAVGVEPLIALTRHQAAPRAWHPRNERPPANIRVLTLVAVPGRGQHGVEYRLVPWGFVRLCKFLQLF